MTVSLVRRAIALVVCAVLGGCAGLAPPTPVAPPVIEQTPAHVPSSSSSSVRLEPVDFGVLPGWSTDHQSLALPALLRSCSAVSKEDRWKPFCNALKNNRDASDGSIRHLVETYLTPYRTVAEGGGTGGLVTGYYEPVLRGARLRHTPFLTPLYRVPTDLIDVDPSLVPDAKGVQMRGRLIGRTLAPYPTRAELSASHALAGQELVWVEDPVEAFFLQVQGSGKIQLMDSGVAETIRVAYADQNGQPYRSIGKWLIDQHEIGASDASMQGIKAWILAHPGRSEQLFNVNPRVVFFKEEALPDPLSGPKGALGVPLTEGRSIAVDARVVPLGTPVFLATSLPNSAVAMQRLVSAQDTGAAIVTAPGSALRVDLYFGSGATAGEDAGRMKQAGEMWLLLPNGPL